MFRRWVSHSAIPYALASNPAHLVIGSVTRDNLLKEESGPCVSKTELRAMWEKRIVDFQAKGPVPFL